jgi:hypothetical protein
MGQVAANGSGAEEIAEGDRRDAPRRRGGESRSERDEVVLGDGRSSPHPEPQMQDVSAHEEQDQDTSHGLEPAAAIAVLAAGGRVASHRSHDPPRRVQRDRGVDAKDLERGKPRHLGEAGHALFVRHGAKGRAGVLPYVQDDEASERKDAQHGMQAIQQGNGLLGGGRFHVRPPGRRVAGVLSRGLLIGSMFACSASERTTETPVPAAAQTRPAQQAFRRIQARWASTPWTRRTALRPELVSFLERFPEDPKARFVNLYLAWLDVEDGNLDQALARARADRRHPAGAAADLASVIEASVLSRRDRAKDALALLMPLRGKMVDPDDRALHAAELVRAAIGARRYGQALSYMLDWAEQGSGGDQETVKASIEEQVRAVPPVALERALPSLQDATGASSPNNVQRWLARVVREQLVRTALARRDVALAQRLLDGIPTSLRMDESREALRELAALGRVAPRIAGRAIGLVLELGGHRERRRSAEVAAGISRALGLVTRDGDTGAVQLLSREAPSVGGVEDALAALAGEGAAVLVAGVVEQSAERAAEFAERNAIPVLVPSAPSKPPPAGGFTFVLGEPAEAPVRVLEEALAARGRTRLVRIGAASSVSCDSEPASAGHFRFPVTEWKKDRVDGVLLLGDRVCAADVLAEARAARLGVGVALGLEAAVLLPSLDADVVVAAGAGRYPQTETGREMAWFEALGADAARLADGALRKFPLEQTLDDATVRELHRRARDAMAGARAALETTEATGFAGGRRMVRTVRAVERGASR